MPSRSYTEDVDLNTNSYYWTHVCHFLLWREGLPSKYVYKARFMLRLHVAFKPVENVRCEVFTAVIMKNGVFWDVTPCGSSISSQRASVASYS
jgi:hypothetical protein